MNTEVSGQTFRVVPKKISHLELLLQIAPSFTGHKDNKNWSENHVPVHGTPYAAIIVSNNYLDML